MYISGNRTNTRLVSKNDLTKRYSRNRINRVDRKENQLQNQVFLLKVKNRNVEQPLNHQSPSPKLQQIRKPKESKNHQHQKPGCQAKNSPILLKTSTISKITFSQCVRVQRTATEVVVRHLWKKSTNHNSQQTINYTSMPTQIITSVAVIKRSGMFILYI